MSDEKTLTETDIQTAVEIPLGGKKNVILDSQILTALMSCFTLTDYRFNHNLISIGGKSNSLEAGSLVHVFLEYYYKHRIMGVSRNEAAGFAMAAAETYIAGCAHCTGFTPHTETQPNGAFLLVNKPTCGHKVDEFPGLQNTPPDSEGYKIGWKFVLQTCEEYVNHYKNDAWIPIDVETVKGKIIYEDDEIRILWKSKIDLTVDTLNAGILSVDHKTMKQRRDTLSLNNQFKGQCIVMETRNVVINKVGFQKTLPADQRFQRVVIPYSSDRLIEWAGTTVPFWARMMIFCAENGFWPMNFSNCETKYGNCAFKEVCEANPNMREHELKQRFMVGKPWNPVNEGDE